jgi:hypothetical protein
VSSLKTEDVTSPAGTGAFVLRDYSILSELLAEGWAKAIVAWEKQNQLPVSFGARLTPAPEKQPEKIPALQTATT